MDKIIEMEAARVIAYNLSMSYKEVYKQFAPWYDQMNGRAKLYIASYPNMSGVQKAYLRDNGYFPPAIIGYFSACMIAFGLEEPWKNVIYEKLLFSYFLKNIDRVSGLLQINQAPEISKGTVLGQYNITYRQFVEYCRGEGVSSLYFSMFERLFLPIGENPSFPDPEKNQNEPKIIQNPAYVARIQPENETYSRKTKPVILEPVEIPYLTRKKRKL